MEQPAVMIAVHVKNNCAPWLSSLAALPGRARARRAGGQGGLYLVTAFTLTLNWNLPIFFPSERDFSKIDKPRILWKHE